MSPRIEKLAYWIREREDIRLRKEEDKIPPPWTSDSILSSYRFCNVRREDDKVTRWLKKNWRDPHADSMNMTPALVLARLINLPETLEKVGFPVVWDYYQISEGVRKARNSQTTWINSAYLVTTCGVQMDKMDYICQLAQAVYDSRAMPHDGDTLENFHAKLMKFKGLGSFFAAQVVADLKNIAGNPLATASDWWDWCAVGPGSIKGLRAVTANPDLPLGQFQSVAQTVRQQVEEINGPLGICMQDFQNCLCEFSKYWRAYTGEGRPKQRYYAHS